MDAKYVGKQSADWLVGESNKIYQNEINVRGNKTELGMGAKEGTTIAGKTIVRHKFYEGETNHVKITGSKWTYRLHNHPGGTAPSYGDYRAAQINWNNGIYSQHGLYSNGSFYGYQSTPGNYIYGRIKLILLILFFATCHVLIKIIAVYQGDIASNFILLKTF